MCVWNENCFLFLQKNGVILLSADQLAVPDDHQESYFPKYLLFRKVNSLIMINDNND